MKISLSVTLISAILVMIAASRLHAAGSPANTHIYSCTDPCRDPAFRCRNNNPPGYNGSPADNDPTGLPLPKSIKDTPLLFAISAPEGYAGTTIRATTYEYSILYKTTIFNPANGDANTTINNNSGIYIPLSDSLTVFLVLLVPQC